MSVIENTKTLRFRDLQLTQAAKDTVLGIACTDAATAAGVALERVRSMRSRVTTLTRQEREKRSNLVQHRCIRCGVELAVQQLPRSLTAGQAGLIKHHEETEKQNLRVYFPVLVAELERYALGTKTAMGPSEPPDRFDFTDAHYAAKRRRS